VEDGKGQGEEGKKETNERRYPFEDRESLLWMGLIRKVRELED
jgi:hypothetical protein